MNNSRISPRKNVFNILQDKGVSIDKQYLVTKEDNSIASPFVKGKLNGLDIVIEMDNNGTVPIEEFAIPYKIREVEEINEAFDDKLEGLAMICEEGLCVKTNKSTKIMGEVNSTPEIVPVVKLSKIINPSDDIDETIRSNAINLKLLEMENLQSELNVLSNYLTTAMQLFNVMKTSEESLVSKIRYYVDMLLKLKQQYEDIKKNRIFTPEEEQKYSLVKQGLERKLQLIKQLDHKLIELKDVNFSLDELIVKLNDITKFVNAELQYVDRV